MLQGVQSKAGGSICDCCAVYFNVAPHSLVLFYCN